VTRGGALAHRIGPRRDLESAIRFFVGLLRESGEGAATGASRLYDDLLREAQEALPEGITRLIVVPDGALHGLPFDALRPGPDAPPIVETQEVVLAPSVSLWLRLRQSGEVGRPASALLLADPEPPIGSSSDARARWADRAGPLGRLPYARVEAQQALRALHGRGELRLGSEATESSLKATDLRRHRLLHLAAHAVVDETDPARSAILLSPGEGREDGLLQAREVGDLDLDGTLVVLSACRSAQGPVVTGEGVLGLARSFFQARASAIVGGLWPVGDRETAELMSLFYGRLAAGDEVASALAYAKRERRREGAPSSAWAGLVVLGDGALSPWSGAVEPGRRSSVHPALGVAVLVLLVLAAGSILLARRFRRLRPAGSER
jgi:CHAT domain-containing protein